MSHELTETNGIVEFAYRADHGLPWHGLGQAVPAADFANMDAWRTHAGMQWKVARSRVRFGEGASQQTWDDQHVLFRSDTKAPLGIVSPGFKIVQPAEVLDFFRDLATAAGVEMSAAGTLQGGRRFWGTAKFAEGSPISKGDRLTGYLLFTTGADGGTATTIARRVTRAVCANTIAMANAEGAAEFRLTHRSEFDARAVKDFMGLSAQTWADFKANALRLANKPVDDARAAVFVANLLANVKLSDATDAAGKARAKAVESAGFDKVIRLFKGDAKGSDFDGVQGTAWGLLNAVTEYADHHVRAHNDANRLLSAQWGAGNELKSRTLATLLAA
jgi:phage/plasmid-like protein (TIGR03299 family)